MSNVARPESIGRGFEDLEVWKLARTLVNQIYGLSNSFPSEERFGLTSQLRRASVSVMSNIAEGWGRHSEASFANFLDMAQGSLSEVQSLSYVCLDQGFISVDSFALLENEVSRLGAKLYRFIAKLRPTVVRESVSVYDFELI